MSSESEDSSSGEDVPLAALGGKHLRPPGINSDESSSEEEEEEAEFDENAEEEEEPSSEEDNDDDDFIVDDSGEEEELQAEEESDSDDDVPLASLKSPKGKKAAAGKKKEKKPAAKKKTAAKPKKKAAAKTKKAAAAAAKKKKANGAAASSASSDPTTASGHLYAKGTKGRLIQSVLCRWWYVVTWPDLASVPPCPRHYDALDGFPGVYVCTSGDDVGKIIDHRDPSTCPSFANFAKKSSDELVEMLVTAITKQKEQLLAAEGEGTDTEQELDELESWARRVDTSKADREADKILKAAKIVL